MGVDGDNLRACGCAIDVALQSTIFGLRMSGRGYAQRGRDGDDGNAGCKLTLALPGAHFASLPSSAV
jgi:hypothetical protein